MLLGEQVPPKLQVEPKRVLQNSWEDVADLCAAFGLALDDWQVLVLECALGERRDGSWAAKQVGLSAPRQNGKSQLIIARILAGALLFNEKKIVVSAHAQDTARETFAKLVELIDENPALGDRVSKVMNALNRESVTFKNGTQVQFKARSISGGRGFSSDCLLLDEAQILGMPAWRSINSTMSARPNPQVWLLGTPPTPEDNGEVFTAIRNSATGGKSSTLAWLEWGAEVGDDPALEETRRKANPAWDIRINHEVVQGEFETYSAADFALERLGIWASEYQAPSTITPDAWSLLVIDPDERPAGNIVVGVKFSVDGSLAGLSVAVKPDDSDAPVHVDGLRVASTAEGYAWIADWCQARTDRISQIVIDGKGSDSVLIDLLLDRGFKTLAKAKRPEFRFVRVPSIDEYCTAHESFLQAVLSEALTHGGGVQLDGQVGGSMKRAIGNKGGWGWRPIRDTDNTVLLDAATLAFWGASTCGRKPLTALAGGVVLTR